MRKDLCPLRTFSHPRLRGVLPGLLWNETAIEVDKRIFSCCGGEGQIVFAEGALNCPLRQRLKRIRAVSSEFQQRYLSVIEKLPKLTPFELGQTLEWLAKLEKGGSAKGFVFERKEENEPSVLWTIRLMATWRFDIDIIWHEIGRDSLGSFFAKLEKIKLAPLALVGTEVPLWKEGVSEEIASIVNACEKYLIPLSISFGYFKKEMNAKTKGHTTLAANYQRELQNLRAKLPLTWLDRASLSRIHTTTENPSQYGAEW